MNRARLRELLDRRVERFFAAGLDEEVRRLLQEGVSPRAKAFKAIGYREVLEAIEGGRRMRGGDAIQRVQDCIDNQSQGRSSWLREVREKVRQRTGIQEVVT